MNILIWERGTFIGFVKGVNYNAGRIYKTQNKSVAKTYTNPDILMGDIDFCQRVKPQYTYTYR